MKQNTFVTNLVLAIIFLSSVLTGQYVFADEIADREAQLKEQLKKIEQEQLEIQKDLNVQKGKSATIERDVNILSGEIQKAQLNINKKNLLIGELGEGIALKDQTVQQLNQKMNRSKESLAQLIKKTNQLDDASLIEAVITQQTISELFADLDSYSTIKDALEDLFDEIRELRGLTEEEKIQLQQKKEQEENIKAEIEQEKRVVAVKKSEKDTLLAASKQQEQTYETVLAAKQQQAAAIRAALFQLRDSAGISFGDALSYAEAASKATGVRTAFILAILKQESDLGKNVGTCNRAGDPPHKKWTAIMPGPTSGSWRDDQTIFLQITAQLGLDPDTTPLSCPLGSGWGGAMGPSQFIPTTWNSYAGRVAALLGVGTANPWNPQHAFMATAVYMQDLGAGAQTFTAEKTAALKYYAGGNWSLPQNQFYGNSVMQHAAGFQQQIDFLKDVE